jgi:Ca2+-binding RTX toxin-like protein
MATIKGTSKKNSLAGTDFSDLILGLGGDDRLFGGDGNDTLRGGAGNDKLFGGAGNDKLFGDAGNDSLDGGKGRDSMRGGLGNDTYVVDDAKDKVVEGAGQGIDTVWTSVSSTKLLAANIDNLVLTGHALDGVGNALDNTITGNSHDNKLGGAGGNDVLFGGAGSDQINGGDGDDTLFGGAGKDFLIGGTGDDKFSGGAGADGMQGDDGFDFASYQSSTEGVFVNLESTNGVGLTIGIGGDAQGDSFFGIEGLIGSNFNDDLTGRIFVTVVNGVVQNSGTALIGGGGNDIMHGTALDDLLIDGVADLGPFNGITDSFFNIIGSGDDILFGGAGSDFMAGGIGNDTIFGGSDSDTIAGGAGADHITGKSPGNPESNKFLYFATTDSGVGAGQRDVITDFTAGDKIDLSSIDRSTDPQFASGPFFFGGQQVQGHIASFALSVPNPTPEVSFYFQGSNTIVQAYISDNHGNAINRFEIELTGHIVLTANDFVL